MKARNQHHDSRFYELTRHFFPTVITFFEEKLRSGQDRYGGYAGAARRRVHLATVHSALFGLRLAIAQADAGSVMPITSR